MNITQLLVNGYKILKENEIDSYKIDTQLLLQKVLEVDKLFILTNRSYEVTMENEKEFMSLLQLRKNKMPVKYILGHCEFMGLDFLVREGVLIPRPDTEILVEHVLQVAKANNAKSICDVCCGSGAIGISLSHFLGDVQVSCCDLSETAIEVTSENANRLLSQGRVKVVKSDLLHFAIEEKAKFDIIVSNPPYIKEKVIETLMEDVRNYEPYMALSGGEDGLDFYKEIITQSLMLLNKEGVLAFEIGHDQGVEVKKLMEYSAYKNVNILQDLAGFDRVVIGNI
ncbi:MAG: peptide chain release factor N(5)-glutamine methyltransferase [Clostridiaceae bacterium]|nr:peptide chain release factor N(5)-glutamine methyltransferase [Clostridiaceae bacterium]